MLSKVHDFCLKYTVFYHFRAFLDGFYVPYTLINAFQIIDRLSWLMILLVIALLYTEMYFSLILDSLGSRNLISDE